MRVRERLGSRAGMVRKAASGHRAATRPSCSPAGRAQRCASSRGREALPREVDVVVVGSGIGGLCCAALVAKYGYSVCVLESHTIAGGCAHSFVREGYTFDSGPSFFAGLDAGSESNNALKQVLDLLGEQVPCAQYDGWAAYLPEGEFKCESNRMAYEREVEKFGGPSALREWRRLEHTMQPLARSAQALSFANFRDDAFAPLTLAKGAGGFLTSGVLDQGPFHAMSMLDGPFSYLIERAGVKNSFLRNLLDLECFVLSGMPASATLSPEMAYMFSERHREGSRLDYPLGGAGSIVDALCRGLEKNGGKLHLGAHVQEILIEGGRAVGVQLKGGAEVRAKKYVVSNATVWDTFNKLLPPSLSPGLGRAAAKATKPLDSFMHLHLGIDADGLDPGLGIHHLVVNSWQAGVDTDRNVINISIPTMLDPSLAPQGKHVVHAYTAANEPFADWQGLERGGEAYRELKEHRSQCLWQALERFIPDIRERAELALVGTPLTHQRFTRRSRGTYGPGVVAGRETWPSPRTAISGLLTCGDSNFPGIGVPAVAASGLIAANTISSIGEHLGMLEQLELCS